MKKDVTGRLEHSDRTDLAREKKLFIRSAAALLFVVAFFLGAVATLTNVRAIAFVVRSAEAASIYLQTGVFAPPQLFVDTPSSAKPGRLYVQDRGAFPAGWRVVMAYNGDRRVFDVQLSDRSGKVVHEWPISGVFIKQAALAPALIAPHGLVVLPSGAIVVNSDRAQFIAAFDKCGKLLWRRNEAFHHQMSLDDENFVWSWRGEGSPYAQNQFIERIDPATGQTVERISLITDIIKKDDANRLIFGLPATFGAEDDDAVFDRNADYFHPNDVKILSVGLAVHFKGFAAGDILVSFRNLDLIAVIDRKSHKMKWSARGPWRRQHDPEFTDAGEISVFNNNFPGKGENTAYERRTNIISIDPKTGRLRSFLDRGPVNFFTAEMGAHSWLPGNILQIAVPDEGRVLEVDLATGKVVYELNNRVTTNLSANVATAFWLPEDYFDSDPRLFGCLSGPAER